MALLRSGRIFLSDFSAVLCMDIILKAYNRGVKYFEC